MKRSSESGEKSAKKLSLGSGFFKECNIYIQKGGGVSNARAKIFHAQIEKNGGKIEQKITEKTTHVIVDDNLTYEKIIKILDLKMGVANEFKIIGSQWLSVCFKNKKIESWEKFEITPPPIRAKNSPLMATNSIKNKGYVCASPAASSSINLNARVTDQLQLMAETYKNTKDNWRALGYEKAINVLKKLDNEITCYEEAKCLPGIGDRLARKISEIIESGQLRKLTEVCSDEKIKAVNLFAQVWGAGPTTAEMWAQQGHRTLDDLQKGGNLTRQQRIGLKHYHDLLQKIPRDEVKGIIDVVTKVTNEIKSGLELIACGSYRRGRSLCGDVDILITDLRSSAPLGSVLTPIVSALHKIGFLTDDLTHPDVDSESQRGKYFGVCKLELIHRRLDLFVVPREEFGPALLTYTGSAHFNRSMRLLAKKKNMSLTDRGLHEGTLRHEGEKIHLGRKLNTPTEESVFEILGLEYRTPAERDH